MAFTDPLRKTDECDNCGKRMSIKERFCPRCRRPNPDYVSRNWDTSIKNIRNVEKVIEEETKTNETSY